MSIEMAPQSNGKPSKRIAAIDLGTNSFHAVIVDIYPDGSFRTLDKLKEMVDLAKEGIGERLSEEAMARGIESLKKIVLLCEHQGVERILAYATSAIREAENGGAFMQRVIDELQFKAHVISGKMEAELIGHAVQHAVYLGDQKALTIDIGGGSVEFSLLDSSNFYYVTSRKIGVTRMLNRFVKNDPIKKSEIEALESFYRDQISDVAEAFARNRTDLLVGSSGTMENIAEMLAADQKVDPSITLNEFEYTADEFFEFYDKFIKLNHKQRLKVDGLEKKRADMIVPGMVLVRMLLKDFELKRVKTSTEALREGIILKHIKDDQHKLKHLADFPEPRRRSVFELLRKCNWHEAHSRRVTGIALQLFDETKQLHELDDNYRELLEYASLMHDIGYHISHRKHHKHALYIIRNSELMGFKDWEIEVMANLARYHRRSTPKKRHKYFHQLDDEAKDAIRKLAGILRVADGLDRSHFQNVKNIDLHITKKKVKLNIEVEEDPKLEIWGASRKKELFEEMTNRELVIEPQPAFQVM